MFDRKQKVRATLLIIINMNFSYLWEKFESAIQQEMILSDFFAT